MTEQACPVARGEGQKESQKIIISNGQLRKDISKRILLAVMRNEDASCVVQEVMEIQQVHGILEK